MGAVAGHATHNLSFLRRMALNLLLCWETTAKGGIAARRKRAGWNKEYLLRILSNSNAIALPEWLHPNGVWG